MFMDAFPGTQTPGMPSVWAVDGERVPVQSAHVTVGDLEGVFADEAAFATIPGRALVYTTQVSRPIPEGAEGGLFYGHTLIMPGLVGSEFFMTRGHFHMVRNRAEIYWCLGGQGLLVLMTEDRKYQVETMLPGTVHYIPGHTAHRTVNTGHEVLSFTACWPSDAGHDYASITNFGFPVRVLSDDGRPAIVEAAG
jgi:glucose-6-phosphate isomerase, archaeal